MNKIHTHANKTFTHGRKEGGRQALEGQLGFFGLFWFVFWFVFFCFCFFLFLLFFVVVGFFLFFYFFIFIYLFFYRTVTDNTFRI